MVRQTESVESCYELLKACVVLQAYKDYVHSMVNLKILENKDMTDYMLHKRRSVYNKLNRQYRKYMVSRKTHTKNEELAIKDLINNRILCMIDNNRRLANDAKAFFTGDAIHIYTDVDGELILEEADRSVKRWLQGDGDKMRGMELAIRDEVWSD